MPKRAHTVAVATPCWPAPVSAMMRRLPMRRASSAWPSALFSLWAPVWQRSSRFRWMRAPPKCSLSRSAAYSGVGRPTRACCCAFSSSWNSGSAQLDRHAPSRSSRADIRVSGTYCPPYGPNLPLTIGVLYSLHESANPLRILDTDRRLDAAGHVDAVGPQPAHDLADVAGVEAARHDHEAAGHQRPGGLPVPGTAGAAALVGRPAVQQDGVRPVPGVRQRALADLERLHHRPGTGEAGRLRPVQLDQVQAHELGHLGHLRLGLVDEHPH